MLTTQALESQTQLPVCRYEILSDDPNGIPIKYAKIGDTVYHKWTCISELTDVYCMRVHSCTVYDGQGGPPVTVLDANGCSIDGVILQNLNYLSDLTAGKPAQVFKFADKAGLYFNCQIQLTIKDKQYGCSTSQPQCAQTYVESAAQTTEVSSEYTGSHESGYPTKSVEEYPTSKAQGKKKFKIWKYEDSLSITFLSYLQYVTSTISSFNGPNNAYTRLIKRNIQSAGE
uniref:ZP domain-containing protein n=1 Tax=Heterorhabditis bacteriophora TaxID=37862 RepID=A0A1I7XPH5_HETBA